MVDRLLVDLSLDRWSVVGGPVLILSVTQWSCDSGQWPVGG